MLKMIFEKENGDEIVTESMRRSNDHDCWKGNINIYCKN